MKNKIYMDINGFDCEEEPNICAGYYAFNDATNYQGWFVKTLDGTLYHPNTSTSEIKKATIRLEQVSEAQYLRYKKFLTKRNEIIYSKLAREI